MSRPKRQRSGNADERLKRENERLRRELAERERQLAEATKEIADAKKQIADLERQLALRNQNSTISSKPPASDGLAGRQRVRGRRRKSRRKPGGQPGHPGHSRPLVPAERVNATIDLVPERCRHCQRALHARDAAGNPRRHQVTELPPIEAHITEYRCHRRRCRRCGRLTQATLPEEVIGQFGPQLTALIAYLTVVCRLPRLVVQRFLEGALQIPISLGSTQHAWEEASAAVAAPYAELEAALRHEAVLNADETGHRTNGDKRWLWTFVARTFIVYRIAAGRGSDVLKTVLGSAFAGILASDRLPAYLKYVAGQRQFCWAHVTRNLLSALDLATTPAAKRFCREALALDRRLFRLWHFAGPAETERPRTRLTSVPYALRASDADTLGGRPASAYVLAPPSGGSSTRTSTTTGAATTASSTTTAASTSSADVVLAGTPNYLAKYVNSADVGPSALFENGGLVGLGTAAPVDVLHVQFTNTNGAITGYAVQNLGNTATSYSGMLFYDQNGTLGQFQGFNNSTHEYRINNIARNGASQFNGSINFMIGSTSRFLVTSPGNIGIGTMAPNALLDVSNALIPTSAIANIATTSFGANSFGSEISGRKARGTASAPAAVQNGDALAIFGGKGYGATGFSGFSSGMSVLAGENWTDTAQGTQLNFTTTPTGTTQPVVRMNISSSGNVGVGGFATGASLEVTNALTGFPFANVQATSFTGASPAASLFVGRTARGTSAAPAAAQAGDNLAAFLGRGFGTTAFSGTRGGMFVQAAENWTDTAQGTRLNFNTTAIGTTSPGTKMTIDPAGNVGIGTFNPEAALEISRTGTDSFALTTVYANGSSVNPFYATRFANGTPAAPTAAQSGDILGAWLATGYGATQFGGVTGGMGVIAQENWTDTAQGSATGFLATPLGSVTSHLYMGILPNGNVGIGDWAIPGGTPTAADKLQVFGDVRVGTSGTNGCVKRFDGTGIAGTCSSDRRLKKNITPFGPALNQLAALQPVHFNWRAAEFPDRHFGEARAYGLIAQDVEAVLPELVVTDQDGFKAVDYTKLPLLTIQAVKELKAENDDLKARVAALERMVKEMRPSSTRH